MSSPTQPEDRLSVSSAAVERKTVLVVDQQADCRVIFGTMLEHHGYRVIQAMDGLEGLRLALAERPDAITSELLVPGLSGLELARELKREPTTAGIPLIAVTSQSLDPDREVALAAGFSAYLIKPIHPRSVVAEVERAIGPGASLPV